MPEGAKDKPVISGEFHLSSIAKGLPYGWFLEVPNAKAAAKAYKKYMNSPIDNSQILEAHWFQWPDMFKTVRADGANATCGFVSIIDAPDYALADACAMFPQKCTKGALVNRHLLRLEKWHINTSAAPFSVRLFLRRKGEMKKVAEEKSSAIHICSYSAIRKN